MVHLNFFLHLIILFLVHRSYARVIIPMASADLIESACKTNDDPAACFKLLNSVPETRTANLTGLGLISLKLAQTHIKETIDHIVFMNEITTDQRLHDIFSKCNTWYGLSQLWLDGATEALISSSYEVAHDLSWNVGEGAKNCEAEFRASPSRSSPLTDGNELTYRLCRLVTRISDMPLDGEKSHA